MTAYMIKVMNLVTCDPYVFFQTGVSCGLQPSFSEKCSLFGLGEVFGNARRNFDRRLITKLFELLRVWARGVETQFV